MFSQSSHIQGFRAVVVSPTRELAQQVCAAVIVVFKIYHVCPNDIPYNNWYTSYKYKYVSQIC